jgi:hypothetical protein
MQLMLLCTPLSQAAVSNAPRMMQEGADVDDYVANLEDWNQQRLLLARQHEGGFNVLAAMHLLDQHKPTIMHTIETAAKCIGCATNAHTDAMLMMGATASSGAPYVICLFL